MCRQTVKPSNKQTVGIHVVSLHVFFFFVGNDMHTRSYEGRYQWICDLRRRRNILLWLPTCATLAACTRLLRLCSPAQRVTLPLISASMLPSQMFFNFMEYVVFRDPSLDSDCRSTWLPVPEWVLDCQVNQPSTLWTIRRNSSSSVSSWMRLLCALLPLRYVAMWQLSRRTCASVHGMIRGHANVIHLRTGRSITRPRVSKRLCS